MSYALRRRQHWLIEFSHSNFFSPRLFQGNLASNQGEEYVMDEIYNFMAALFHDLKKGRQ